MKKTIFALFMIGLMLVGSSAMSISVNNCEDNSNIGSGDNSEEPDFIVSTLTWVPMRCPGCISAHVRIRNIGAEIEEEIMVNVKVTLDSDQETLTIDYTGVGSSPILYAHLKYKLWKRTHTLTAEVDPPYEGHPKGDIIESNENNNVKSKSFKTNMKPQSSSLLNFLDIFQISFQILRHLLNCKVSFYPG